MNIRATASAPPSIKSEGSQDNINQLEQQKQAITKQLESLKQNDKLKPEEKEKKIKVLQKKLKEIESQIQKLKQNTGKTSEATKNTKSENVELSDNLKSVSETKATEEISQSTTQSGVQRPKMDEYVKGEEPVSTGTYKVDKDENGNLQISFDDPMKKSDEVDPEYKNKNKNDF